MDSEKLNQHLFSAVTRVYAVLDGAAIHDLLMKFYELKPPFYCLLTGDLEPDMAQVAPYLVRLYPKTPFTNWLLQERAGKNRGIFAHSRKTLEEMRKHFRSLMTVYDEKGEPMTFRFYDPRVLNKYLSTCSPEELNVIFGDVETFFTESEDSKKLTSLQLTEEDNLKRSVLDIE